jgi:hypothetical protein
VIQITSLADVYQKLKGYAYLFLPADFISIAGI